MIDRTAEIMRLWGLEPGEKFEIPPPTPKKRTMPQKHRKKKPDTPLVLKMKAQISCAETTADDDRRNGTGPYEEVKRNCLGCGKNFLSKWIGNRMCPACHARK